MKIVVLLGKFPSLSQIFIVNQITGLIDRGHTVDIFALEGHSGESKVHPQVDQYQLAERARYAIPPPEFFPFRLGKAIAILSTHLIRALARSFNPPVKYWLQALNFIKYGKKAASLRLLFAAFSFFESGSYDIVHCQFGTYALIGMRLKQIGVLNGPLITSLRGYDISSYPQQHGSQVYDELFQFGDFFLANCEYFRQKAIALGCPAHKIAVLASGIDCSKFPYRPSPAVVNGVVKIVTVGRLVEKKGIEYAIQAVAQLLPRYPTLEYIIIGDGELYLQLKSLIQSLNADRNIHLLGKKTQPEIVDILHDAHIFVASSVTAKSGDQDAPVNTLKEAMAIGLPVIATRHGGIPELVQDNLSGFLVAERNSEDLAVKLETLLQRPERWDEMGRAGHSYVHQHYDMETLNEQLIEIYSRFCNSR